MFPDEGGAHISQSHIIPKQLPRTDRPMLHHLHRCYSIWLMQRRREMRMWNYPSKELPFLISGEAEWKTNSDYSEDESNINFSTLVDQQHYMKCFNICSLTIYYIYYPPCLMHNLTSTCHLGIAAEHCCSAKHHRRKLM